MVNKLALFLGYNDHRWYRRSVDDIDDGSEGVVYLDGGSLGIVYLDYDSIGRVISAKRNSKVNHYYTIYTFFK